jgi:hypothetical protein
MRSEGDILAKHLSRYARPDPFDALATLGRSGQANKGGRPYVDHITRYALSSASAMPMPPLTHKVAKPRRALRLSIS